MTIPASIRPDQNAAKLQSVLTSLRREASAVVTECDTGTINLVTLANSRLQALINAKEAIEELELTSGIAAAYAALYPNDTFTFATEIASIKTEINDFITYVETQIPQDNGGYLLITQFDANKKLVSRTVSNAGPIATLKGHAESIVNLIIV